APCRTRPTGTRYGPGVLRTHGAASGSSLRHNTQHTTLAHAGERDHGLGVAVQSEISSNQS
ncbi:MAG: hypothetical protein ACI80K_004030, partial [Paracoccaceae bacterium]